MAYEPGLVTLEVTNETRVEISKSGYYFPENSTKVVVVPAADVLLIKSRRGLSYNVLGEAPEDVEIDRPFNFIKDQDQNVTNRSPGQSDDWLTVTHPESTALPALQHGRMSELRVEKGAASRAEELGVDIFGVSGTGEEGLVTVRDVENAYEGVSPLPQAGVKGGADIDPAEEGILLADEEEEAEILASDAARKKAGELGVDLRQATGTGANGNIVVQDIEAFADAQEQHEELDEEQREAIEKQKEVDELTPPPPPPGEPVAGETGVGPLVEETPGEGSPDPKEEE